MTAGEMYDGRGELWRVQEIGQAPDYRPQAQTCWTTGGEWFTTCWQAVISPCRLNLTVRPMWSMVWNI